MEPVTVKSVIKNFKTQTGLTDQKIAETLGEKMLNTNISRVAVTNWLNGNSAPSTDFLLLCAVIYQDLRRDLAIECLKAKLPEVFDSGMIVFSGKK